MSRSPYDKLHRRFGQTLPETEISARSAKLIALDRSDAARASSQRCGALKKTRVAIVGGGFAGMMAAWSLCPQGVEVVVFEAGKDVGGRVRSDKTLANGRVIEFGAELVGANFPVWLGLARDLGIGLMTRTGENHYHLFGLEMRFRIDGKDIDPKEGERVHDGMRKVFVEIGNDAKQIGDPAAPWLHKPNQKFDSMSVDEKLTGKHGLGLSRNDLVYKVIKLQLENDLVVPLDKINYLGLLCLVKAGRFGIDKDDEDRDFLGFWEQQEALRCTDGCQLLVKRMVERLSDKKHYKFTLLTNTAIKEIAFDLTEPVRPRPATLKWERNAAAPRVNADFDYVILAVPPSVWGDIKITPEHPKDKVGSMQMGPAIKFFSVLADRFWIDEKHAPSGISSKLGMIWEGTDNQTLIDKQEIVLSVFAGGPMTDDLKGEENFRIELRPLYKNYDKKRKGKDKRQSWRDEKFIKTGYWCPKPGDMFKTAPLLQEPFDGRHLFLAGEHTQTDFFGFMEGALRSGRRVAEALIAEVCPQTRVT